VALISAAALGAAVLAGCGGGSSATAGTNASATSAGGAGSAPAANPAVGKLVPAALKSKGVLVAATSADYAPDEFIASNGHTIVGFDADLAAAIARQMGVKLQIVNASFDSLIPGLAAHKYDIAIASQNDTKQREKVVDFVDYFNAGESFFTKAQGGLSINSIADLCGHSVAVEKATTEVTDAQTQSTKCTKAGKAPVTVLQFPDQNGANLALVSGRAQLGFADSPVAAYQVKRSGGQFKLVGQPYASGLHGIAMPKGSGLAKPVLAALKALIADGQYHSILAKWGVTNLAIGDPAINGATS
jgi:polar amino acid transport system substrate-binding protein